MAEASTRENQSRGNESRESSDIGCAFLANKIGRATKPQETENRNMDAPWSSGVLPGISSGIADRNRNSGAHANGLRRGQTNGLSL